MEAIDGIPAYITHFIRVIALHHLPQIPTFRIVERRNNIEILEQSKCRTYRNIVLETIVPLVQPCLQDQIVLGTDGIGDTTGILQGNLFIPTFFSGCLFTLERINTVQGNVQVRRRYTDGRVTRILSDIECSGQVQTNGRESARITHTGSLRIVGIHFRIIQTAQITTVITTCRKIHIRRETAVRTCLLVLAMAPSYLKVFGNHIIRHVLLAGLCHQIAGIERTTIFITLGIVRLGGQSPGAFRENFSQDFQVHIVTDGKIISPVTQVKTTVHFIAERRHDEARRITAAEREKAERNSNRQRHIFHHQLGRSEYYILFRTNFGLSQFQIKVRMFMVACRIFTIADKEFVARAFLGLFTGYISFPLLGYNAIDEPFLAFKIIAHVL